MTSRTAERVIHIQTIGNRNGTGLSPRNAGTCPQSGKVQWHSEDDALSQALIYATAHRFKTGSLGAYLCSHCNLWHIRSDAS